MNILLPKPICPLSPRQIEVVGLMADGKSAREISIILGLSHNTINSYIATALDVTGTCKATGLVAHCLRKGWIQ